MTDQSVDGPAKPAGGTPGTAAGKALESEGGASRGAAPGARTARASEPVMDRIERSAGRIKARLGAKSGR